MKKFLVLCLSMILIGCGGGSSSSPNAALPSIPTGLTATGGGAQVALAWTAATGALGYNVYYGTTAGVTTTSGTKITAATSSNTITGLTNGTPYFFVVTAVNAWGQSLVSTEVSATPHFTPTGVTISGGDKQVFLNWTAVAGVASYNVYYGTAAGVTTTTGTKIPGATSSNAITGLTNGTPYYFVVTAVSAAGGESLVSTEVNSTPQPLTTLQSALTYPIQFVVDATNLYWTEGTAVSGVAATGSIMKAPLLAASGIPLASNLNEPFGITVDATNVYWTEQGSGAVLGSVNKKPLAGGAVTPLVTLLPASPQYLAVDASNVYFTQFGSYNTAAGMRNADGSVNTVPLAGGGVTQLATLLNGPQSIKIDTTNVYWTDLANFIGGAGTVKQVPIAGGAVKTLASGLSGSQNIAVDATSVFYWSSFGTLAAVPIGGITSTTLVSGMSATSPLALSLDVNGNYTDIYWTESSTQNTVVKKFNKANGKVTALMTVPNNPIGIARNPQWIAVDATSVYWMESDVFSTNNVWTGVGAIYKTSK